MVRVKMREPIDKFIGKKFGALTILWDGGVIKDNPRPRKWYPHLVKYTYKRYVKCRCDCGTIKDLLWSQVKAWRIVSCSCYGHSGPARRPLLWKRFGKLLVIAEDRSPYCTVRCDCWNEYKTRRNSISRSTNCRSCGIKKQRLSYVGKVFGRLTVIEDNDTDYEKASYRYVKCKCDCGNNNYVVRLNSLQSSIWHGSVARCNNCGNNKNYSSYIWQRFWRLTVTWCTRLPIKNDPRKKTMPVFVCDCDCWTKWYMDSVHHIRRWNTSSCWCLRKEIYEKNSFKLYNIKDMIGKKIFHLTIIWEEYKASSRPFQKWRIRYYICRCDCWKEVRIHSGNLMGGKQKSCGCIAHKIKGLSDQPRTIKRHFIWLS